MPENKRNNAGNKADEEPKGWLRRFWPVSTFIKKYDNFVARLETQVIFKAHNSIEEVFASAKDEAHRSFVSNEREQLLGIISDFEAAAAELKRTIHAKGGELKEGLKEARTAADKAATDVMGLSARLSVVETGYEDVNKTNKANKALAEDAARNILTARIAFETAKTKHESALSAAMAAQTAYGNASRENTKVVNGSLVLSGLIDRVEIALKGLEAYRESLDAEFGQRREALFSEARTEIYFSLVSAEQKRLLIELAADFDYDIDRLKRSIEDKRKVIKDNDPNRVAALQKLILKDSIIDSFAGKADALGMEIRDFARAGVTILRELDTDFEQRYGVAEEYRRKADEEAKQPKRSNRIL